MKHQQRFLIMDNNWMSIKVWQDILTNKGYEVEPAYSGPEALKKMQRNAFDRILTNITMFDINNLELYQSAKFKQPHLPFNLMIDCNNGHVSASGKAIMTALSKPLDIDLLLTFLAAPKSQGSLVIIDDDPQFCRILRGILWLEGYGVSQLKKDDIMQNLVAKGQTVLMNMKGIKDNFINSLPELGMEGQTILLDMKLNSNHSLEIVAAIRRHYANLQLIVVTNYSEELTATIEAALQVKSYTCFYNTTQVEGLFQSLENL